VRRLVRDDELEQRAAGRPGATALRELLHEEPQLTRSEAERLLLTLLDRAGLPRPQTNVRVCGLEVDALWPAQRLIVEVDGSRTTARGPPSSATAAATRSCRRPAIASSGSPGTG